MRRTFGGGAEKGGGRKYIAERRKDRQKAPQNMWFCGAFDMASLDMEIISPVKPGEENLKGNTYCVDLTNLLSVATFLSEVSLYFRMAMAGSLISIGITSSQ